MAENNQNNSEKNTDVSQTQLDQLEWDLNAGTKEGQKNVSFY